MNLKNEVSRTSEKLVKNLIKHVESDIADLIDTTPTMIPTDMPYLMGRVYELTNLKYYLITCLDSVKYDTEDEESL
jgi:hypothetical protein